MRRNMQSKRGATIPDDRSIVSDRSRSTFGGGTLNGDWLTGQTSGRQRSDDSSRPSMVPKLKLTNQPATASLDSSSSSFAELAPLVPPITPRENPEESRVLAKSERQHASVPFNSSIPAVDWFDDFDFSSFRSSEAYILSADSHDADATEEGSLRDIVSMDSMSSFIGDDSSEASPRGGSAENDPLADDSFEFSPDKNGEPPTPFLHR